MKKMLWIVGIVMIATAVVSLLLAVLNLIGYYNLLDGSSALYDRLRARMICLFVVGAVLAAVGSHWHHERYDGQGYPDVFYKTETIIFSMCVSVFV